MIFTPVTSSYFSSQIRRKVGRARLSVTVAALCGVVAVGVATAAPSVGAPRRTTQGLVALYSFNEGRGSVVRDVSGVGKPMNLSITTPAATRWVAGGLDVVKPTLIKSFGAATKVNDAIKASDEFTIEAWVQPAAKVQRGAARIVSLASGSAGTNEALVHGSASGAAGAHFTTRTRSTKTTKWGVSVQSRAVASTRLTHLVTTRDRAGNQRLYVDGVLQSSRLTGGALDNWDSDFRLTLAGEIARNRSWLGSYRQVAIYSRALSGAQVKGNFGAGAESSAAASRPVVNARPAAKPAPKRPAPPAPAPVVPAPAPAALVLTISSPATTSVGISVATPAGASSVRLGWTEAGTGRAWSDVYSATDLPPRLTGLVAGTAYDVFASSIDAGGRESAVVHTAATTASTAAAAPAPAPVAPAPAPAPAAPTSGRPKLIKHGWDMPSPGYVRANVAALEALPFDGLTIAIPELGTSVQRQTPVSYEQFKAALAPHAATTFTKLKNNFATAYATPAGSYFGDYSIPIQNFQNLARAAREAGYAGVLYDNEEYFGSVSDHPGVCPGYSLTDCQTQARLRGKQVMDAMRAVWPDIRVMTFFGAWVSEPKTLGAMESKGVVYNDVSASVDLMGSFFVGLVESAAGTPAKVIDGGEVYTARSRSHFAAVRAWQNDGMPANSSLIPAALKPAYANTVLGGFGIYDTTWIGVGMDVNSWESTVANALAETEEYVWLYTEKYDWLGSGWPTTPVPSNWVDATRRARATIG